MIWPLAKFTLFICFSLMVSVAIFAPLVDAGGAFFCLEVFPIFIKFYGGAVFLYSIVIPDFFKN